jgi:hypothetical protein
MAKLRFCVLVSSLVAATAVLGQSANGGFQFTLPGASGAIEFDARVHGSTAKGTVHFKATQEVSGENGDDVGGSGPQSLTAKITVSVDCLRQSGNRASMSGLVTDSNVPGYAGRRAILTVEDNGEGVNAQRDAFTWGVYGNDAQTWTPSDADIPGDNGAMFSWLATDFEVPGDAGIPMGANAPKGTDCKSFGLGSYALSEVAHGAGNIQVRP